MTKDELLALLRLCNADPSAIDAVELAYELGFKAGRAEKSETYPDNFIDALKFDVAKREPLTDDELRELANKYLFYQPEAYEVSGVFAFARIIEQSHGIVSPSSQGRNP